MMTFQLFLLIALSFKVVSTYSLPSNGEYLDTTNLIDVLQALKDHNFNEKNWRDLCLYLGLHVNRLDNIEEDHHNVHRCLEECLKSWLSQDDGAKSPTWFSLIVAMRDTGEITTANGIDREKHPACEILDRYTSDPTVQKNLLSLGITYLLHAEKIVTKKIWLSEEVELLLNDVQNAICKNYQLLKTFAVILQKSATTVTVGNAIMKEYKKEFTNEVNEPYEKMTDEKGIHLDIVNFTEVRMEYAATFDAISKAIKSNDAPSLEELQTFLRRGHGYCKFPSQCESRKDIFDMIADECTLINIGLLESVVNFYKNEEAKHIIEQYKKYIDDFNQMKLHRFLDKKFSDGSLLQSETALFYVDRSIKESTLEDVRLLLRTAFTKRDQDVKVVVIREGNSYIITCSFPLHLSMELILSATENIEELKKKGLQRLTIGFSTVYDKVKDEVCEQEMQMTQMGFMTMGESHCPSDNSYGMLEQMAIYMSVNQLNEASYEEDTEIGIKSSDSGPSSWLSILLLLCIITIYVLVEPVLTDQRRETKSTQTPDKTKESKKELKTQVADKEMIIAKLTEEKLKLKEELQSLSDDTKDKEENEKLKVEADNMKMTIAMLTEKLKLKEELQSISDNTKDKEGKITTRSDSDDAGADAAPHTWRHFKRTPKEVIIIGSFGNHEQWKLPETIVSPKIILAGVEGSYEEWIAEEVESISKIYKKEKIQMDLDPGNYELKEISENLTEKEQSRQYYLDKITSLFENCKKDEALIYYTGHGEKDTGNWCFKDGVISFNDIFELYMMHFRGKSLQIVSDCSYSGKWIHDCGKKLDEYGILSCGHKTREQRMLFKIFTSCQPHEEATLLTYSRKGIRYSEEDKGVLIKYDEEIKMEPAQKGQHPMHVDFRHIHCYKMPGDQCELDSTCTWEDRLGKKREQIVFLVDNKHDKFPSWYYLLISGDTFDEFKGKGSIGVEEATKYGKVLYSGPGKNPSSDVKKKLNLRFDMNTYASYEYTDR